MTERTYTIAEIRAALTDDVLGELPNPFRVGWRPKMREAIISAIEGTTKGVGVENQQREVESPNDVGGPDYDLRAKGCADSGRTKDTSHSGTQSSPSNPICPTCGAPVTVTEWLHVYPCPFDSDVVGQETDAARNVVCDCTPIPSDWICQPEKSPEFPRASPEDDDLRAEICQPKESE